MTLSTLIRRTIIQWQNWRSRKAMRRAVPILKALSEKQAIYRKGHKAGSARITRERIKAVNAVLAGRPAQSGRA
jgi:hypothetical protein